MILIAIASRWAHGIFGVEEVEKTSDVAIIGVGYGGSCVWGVAGFFRLPSV